MATRFVPRSAFPSQFSLPRSYFLGHHAAGLAKMKTMLSSTDLIIECRDYRVPLTSRNPLFERSLAGRERLVVYTKRDLGNRGKPADKQREEMIRAWHRPSSVLFSDHRSKKDIKSIFEFAKDYAESKYSVTGSRMMIVGMPNVGKSSLLNALRMQGVHRGKAASTGAQPGVTRKIASGVKIIDADPEKQTEALYLFDTPGVFIPYVQDAEAMMKLALVGSVKDTIISPNTLADYLLYHMNKRDPELYKEYCGPTNDVQELLEAVAMKTGRLMKGGIPEVEASALWIIQKWRQGNLGRFVLDEVVKDGLENHRNVEVGISFSQAKKQEKESHRRARLLRNSED